MPDSDLLTETQACDLLSRLFRARGFKVVRNIPFQEYGVTFHIDGWDAKQRVGFEFLSSEDEDHDDLTLREYQTLMAAQQRGELSLFILDEVEPLSAADLQAMAEDFLDELADATAARRSSRGSQARKQPAATRPGRAKRAAAKRPAKVASPRPKAKPTTKRARKSAAKPGAKPGRKPASGRRRGGT